MTLEVGGEGWEGKNGVAGNQAIKLPIILCQELSF